MALTGLEIFKLLPKDNCKKCGMPTCLAFAMQLAQKRVKLDDCPCASENAKQVLAAAAAPPMRLVKFGKQDQLLQVGQETTIFRHEEKFHNPAVVAVSISDTLGADALKQRIAAVSSLKFERVGATIGVNSIAVFNESKSADAFSKAAAAVAATGLAPILISDAPESIAAALEAIKPANIMPIIGVATLATAEAMAKIAKVHKCPLVAKAGSIQELADLTAKIKAAGAEDILLCLDGLSTKELFYNLARIRVLSLKKAFNPLGYPVISFVKGGDGDSQAATAIGLVCKYSNIVVLDTAEPYVFLPILTTIMNIYSDPQKPVQVESKVYAVGEPNENSPLLLTTNFSLTYYTVESDVESSRVPSYILCVDTEGTSVLTAYSGDKLNEKVVAAAMTKHGVANMLKHRKLIIPGYVAVMSGKLEEATGWQIMVGPRESSMLPKYLQEIWK